MFASGAADIDGQKERWIEEGVGPHILLLHGVYAGAGSHEWHDLVPLLTAFRTARTVDLLGFAASDHPSDFSRDKLRAAVAEAIRDAPRSCVVVASSLTAAYAVAAMGDDDSLVRPLVLITPSGLGESSTSVVIGAVGRAADFIVAHTPVGDVLSRALVSGRSVRWFLRHRVYRDPHRVTDDIVSRHTTAGADPHNKFALASFVTNQLALNVDPAVIAALRPTVLWADGQAVTENAEAERWVEAGATVLHSDAGLPQVEAPLEVAELLLGFAPPAAAA